jgi:hypothetical protein
MWDRYIQQAFELLSQLANCRTRCVSLIFNVRVYCTLNCISAREFWTTQQLWHCSSHPVHPVEVHCVFLVPKFLSECGHVVLHTDRQFFAAGPLGDAEGEGKVLCGEGKRFSFLHPLQDQMWWCFKFPVKASLSKEILWSCSRSSLFSLSFQASDPIF